MEQQIPYKGKWAREYSHGGKQKQVIQTSYMEINQVPGVGQGQSHRVSAAHLTQADKTGTLIYFCIVVG